MARRTLARNEGNLVAISHGTAGVSVLPSKSGCDSRSKCPRPDGHRAKPLLLGK